MARSILGSRWALATFAIVATAAIAPLALRPDTRATSSTVEVIPREGAARSAPPPLPTRPPVPVRSPAAEVADVIQGRVIDPDGAPIRGAAIVVAPLMRAETDDGGRFSVSGRLDDETELVVTARGFVPRSLDLTRGAPGDAVDLGELVLRRGATVRGVVVDDAGMPVASAEIHDDDGDIAINPHTDAAGRFELRDIPPDRYQLFATHDRMATVVDAGGRVWVLPGQTVDGVRLVLLSTATLTGRVTDEDGQPIADARVVAAAIDHQTPTDDVPCGEAISGSDGVFAVDAPRRGPTRLRVTAGGFETQAIDVESGHPVLVELRRVTVISGVGCFLSGERAPPTLTGVVVDARSQRPIRGAEARLIPNAARSQLRACVRGDFVTRTDDEGRFHAWLRPPGASRLEVSARGYAPAVVDSLLPKHDGTAHDLRIELQPGGEVHGVLHSLAGEPIADAFLIARSGEDALEPVTTYDDGSFYLHSLVPGPVELWAFPGDRFDYSGPAGRRFAEVRAEAARDREVTVTLAGSGFGWLRGSVRAYGHAAPELSVELEGAAVCDDLLLDDHGRFHSALLEPGEYLLKVHRDWDGDIAWRRIQVEADRATVCDIELRPARLDGRLVAALDGRPLAGRDVCLLRRDAGAYSEGDVLNHRPVAERQTDSQGRFTFEEVESGAYRLVTSMESEGLAEAELVVDLRGDLTVELRAPPAARLFAHIDETLLEQSGGCIALEMRRSDRLRFQVYVDEPTTEPGFLAAFLPAGQYEVYALDPEERIFARGEVVLRSGEAVHVELAPFHDGSSDR